MEDKRLQIPGSQFNISEHPNVDIFFNAYRHTSIIMSILNLDDYTYADVNDSWERTFGYSRQEVVGRQARSLGLWIDEVQDEQKIREIMNHQGYKTLKFNTAAEREESVMARYHPN
jgi:PAS domain S-box-containing protein